VVRTVHEGLQAVLWNGIVGLAPLIHQLPDGLTAVPLADMPPSRLIIAWNSTSANPLIRSFTHIAAGIYPLEIAPAGWASADGPAGSCVS
jgi:hypothetical protein